MGINGLLPVLKPICEKRHLKAFSQKRVGIDASSWLHKGAFSCALELATQKPTTRYVDYCMHRVRMLLHFGAIPVLVFDGAPLPLKRMTNASRRKLRTSAKEKGFEAMASGDMRAAQDHFQKGIEVTHEMARAVIREIRKLNIEYVVAPYEADAQLAWMSLNDYVDVVVTEDSDLVVYGAKKIFYKMTKSGDGELYETKNLLGLDDPNMRNFTVSMFTWVCVLSGCDFFPGVNGLGIRKAHALVRRSATLRRVLQVIRFDTKYSVPSDFADNFMKACMAFKHQTVFNPMTKKNHHLTPVDDAARVDLPEHLLVPSPGAEEDLSFLGAVCEDSIARAVADGSMHPSKLTVYDEPLDAVQRPLTQSHQPASIARNAKSTRRSTGLVVHKAGSRAKSGQDQRSKYRQGSAKGFFFTAKSPIALGSSPAVGGAFVAPARKAGESERVPSDPLSSEADKSAWMHRSLSTLNPGGVALRHLKRPSSSATAPSSSQRKRQRSMVDFSKKRTAMKAAGRFADSSRRNSKIVPSGLMNSSRLSERECEDQVGKPKDLSEDGPEVLDKAVVLCHVSDEDIGDCPPSPDLRRSPQRDSWKSSVKQSTGDTDNEDGYTPDTVLNAPYALKSSAEGSAAARHAQVERNGLRTNRQASEGACIRFVSPYFPTKRLSMEAGTSSAPTKSGIAKMLFARRK